MRSVPRAGSFLLAVLACCVAFCGMISGCATVAPAPEPEVVAAPAEADMEIEMEDQVLVDVVDTTIARVPVRTYEPRFDGADGTGEQDHGAAWATLVWAHGGSFVHGDLDWPEADWVSRRFAAAGVRVYSVDYRLASETVKAPIPSEDVTAVLRRAAAEHAEPVVVGGASAGGQLATLAALGVAEEGLGSDSSRAASALILVYPTLHRVQREDPALAAATSALPEQRRFGAERIAAMYDFYLGETGSASGRGDVAVAGELPAERLALLPPTVIVNAELDDLRASGEQFAEQLGDAGVPVAVSTQPGTVHGYLNRPRESEAVRAAGEASIDRLVEELHRILDAVAA